MSNKANSSIKLVIICGLLAMLLPLSIDMYLPALPQVARDFGVGAGSVQMTLNIYVIGFAIGQLFCGPLADSYGRKPIITISTLLFALVTAICALAQSIDMLITMRFLHGLTASAGSVVISALMRDSYSAEEFTRMLSFVMLVTIIAPLVAPIAGGWVLKFWSWHEIFWIISAVAVVLGLLILPQINETLPQEKRQPLNLRVTLKNFYDLFQNKLIFSYILASGFSFAGMFAFLNAGPFVYIELNHVSPQDFGYYFALNIVFLFLMTLINSRSVRRFGPLAMFRSGLIIQFVVGVWLLIVGVSGFNFMAMVLGVALYIGCVSMVSSNAMAMILEEFPHIAGTTASLAGTLRFGIGSLVGALLSLITFTNAWPMVSTIFLCASASLFLYLYAAHLRRHIGASL